MPDGENTPGKWCRSSFGRGIDCYGRQVRDVIDCTPGLVELTNLRATRFMLLGVRFVFVLRADAHPRGHKQHQGDPEKDRQSNASLDRANPHVEIVAFRTLELNWNAAEHR